MTCAPDLSPAPISLLWTFSSTSMSFFDCTQGLNCSSSLVQPHQCQVQGTIPALLLLTTLLLIVARMPRAQLAHVRHVNQDLRVLSHQAPFQAVYPKPVIFHKVVFTKGRTCGKISSYVPNPSLLRKCLPEGCRILNLGQNKIAYISGEISD